MSWIAHENFDKLIESDWTRETWHCIMTIFHCTYPCILLIQRQKKGSPEPKIKIEYQKSQAEALTLMSVWVVKLCAEWIKKNANLILSNEFYFARLVWVCLCICLPRLNINAFASSYSCHANEWTEKNRCESVRSSRQKAKMLIGWKWLVFVGSEYTFYTLYTVFVAAMKIRSLQSLQFTISYTFYLMSN